MATLTRPRRAVQPATPLPEPRRWPRRAAVALAGTMAAIYLAIAAGLLSVGRAEGGDLGILGVAGAVFAGLAVALLVVRRRWLSIGAAVFQVPVFAMYLAVAPDRDPHYEVWGVTLRILQVALFVTLVLLARRRP